MFSNFLIGCSNENDSHVMQLSDVPSGQENWLSEMKAYRFPGDKSLPGKHLNCCGEERQLDKRELRDL